MPGLSLAIAASRRLQVLVQRRGVAATASLFVASRISAPWPPTAGNRSGAKDQVDVVQRTAADQRQRARRAFSSRLKVASRSGGTHTSRGVGARSSKVPSMSSRIAPVQMRNHGAGTGTASRDAAHPRRAI